MHSRGRLVEFEIKNEVECLLLSSGALCKSSTPGNKVDSLPGAISLSVWIPGVVRLLDFQVALAQSFSSVTRRALSGYSKGAIE